MNFDLKRPCKDCPFIIDTSMALSPGRMLGIAEALRDDWTVFPCHKTTHLRGDDEDDGEDDAPGYTYDGSEQACMGALAFTLREHGMLPVMARIACARGTLDVATIKANEPLVEQPGNWPTN